MISKKNILEKEYIFDYIFNACMIKKYAENGVKTFQSCGYGRLNLYEGDVFYWDYTGKLLKKETYENGRLLHIK